MVALELVSVVRTVYAITKALGNWLDDRKEKHQVVCQISSIVQQIHGILLPLQSSLEESTHIDEQQLADCLKKIEEIVINTKEHLLVWDKKRSKRMIAFFNPSSVTKELKGDEQRLHQQLLLLLVAITLKEHVRGRQQSVPVIPSPRDSDLKPHRQHTVPVGHYDLKASPPIAITFIDEPEPELESDLLVFWREFIGEKVRILAFITFQKLIDDQLIYKKSPSVSVAIFCQKLGIWMQNLISDVGLQRLSFCLDETASGKITLVNCQQLAGTRNFRDAVIAFSEGMFRKHNFTVSIFIVQLEPTLPLLIYIGDDPDNRSEHVSYALESNVNVVQLSSTDQAIAWIRINFGRYILPSNLYSEN